MTPGIMSPPSREELAAIPVVLHVYPTYGREHVTDGRLCWCDPEVEVVDGGRVIIHRSMN